MKLLPEADLIEAAAAIRSLNPAIYNQFVAALRAHTVRAAENCVVSSPEHLSVAQGRAQEARLLRDLVENAAEHSAKLRALRKPNP